MFSWHLRVNGPCHAPNTGHGSPCNTCTFTFGIFAMNVLTMLLHLVHLALSLATTLPPAGLVITLTHLPVVMAVTTSARFWKDCSTSEPMERRYLKMGVSAVFTIGFFVSLTCTFVSSVVLLSALFSAHPLCSSGKAMESPTSSVSTASSFGEYFAHNLWIPLGVALSRED